MTLAAPPACHAAALAGSFAAIPGSEGAGNIVYRLRLTNTSTDACVLIGIPRLTLLEANGHAQPTDVIAGRPGALAPVHLTLPAHASGSAQARFSPDVPGVGEGAAGKPCEPVSHSLRITAPGGGTLTVAITPATSVCEHGRLQLTKFSR